MSYYVMYHYIHTRLIVLAFAICVVTGNGFGISSAYPQNTDTSEAKSDVAVEKSGNTAPPSRGDVNGTVRLMIIALEDPKPDYGGFVNEFANPPRNGQPNATQRQGAELQMKTMAPLMLKCLKYINGKTPKQLSDTEVEFDLSALKQIPGPDEQQLKNMPSVMKFHLDEGKWYIR